MDGHSSILNCNITGLSHRKLELETLLVSLKPSIVLNKPTHVYFKGCLTCRFYSDNHGGVVLLERYDVPSRIVNNKTLNDEKHSVITIQVCLAHSYIITCVYRSPSGKRDPFKTFLKDTETDKRHIIIGDLNAKHHT